MTKGAAPAAAPPTTRSVRTTSAHGLASCNQLRLCRNSCGVTVGEDPVYATHWKECRPAEPRRAAIVRSLAYFASAPTVAALIYAREQREHCFKHSRRASNATAYRVSRK